MVEYMVWHPSFGPEKTRSIEVAIEIGIGWIREVKEWEKENPYLRFPRNNVIITREDLPGKFAVVRIKGFRME